MAQQADLSVITSRLLADRPHAGVSATCFVDFSKRRPDSWLSPVQWRNLAQLARRREYDLLFLYSEHPVHLAVSALARARRSVFWCLDPAPHSGGVAVLNLMYEGSRRALLKRADRVIVACDALKAPLASRYGTSADRISAIFHGVLKNLWFPDIVATDRDLDVLFFGRLERYKGLDVLLEAIELLRARGRQFRTLIAGPGPGGFGPVPGVTVENRYIPDRELAGLVARSRVVVMPYRDATGSQVPQTAFSYGTPVIASKVGCLPEYVQDGVTGLVVPPSNAPELAAALERLLGDQILWRRLSEAATKAAESTFDNKALVARLLDVALHSPIHPGA
jgi:glycosyltransferase involved in cell wall biosynthesis